MDIFLCQRPVNCLQIVVMVHADFSYGLPIDDILSDICKTLAKSPSLVIQAPPGAGKTTCVPLALFASGLAKEGRIILLEPRRMAARSAARRMAQMLGEKVGETAGYRVRLDHKVSAKTRIEVVTEGILNRMLQDDPGLEDVAIVIFDEFHERSLDADLGLALTLDCQEGLRDDLKIIVMSATLDGDAVADLMGAAPILTSEGRSYPIDYRYLPRTGSDQSRRGALERDVATAIQKALDEETGSILVFLPGAGEIRRTASLLAGEVPDDVMVCPLFGMMTGKEQDKAISPPPKGKRKVVLATAIAETSLTIEGIRVVIDSGYMRIPRYDSNSGMSRLETIKVSKASADQRAGRAGRLEPGVSYRLWSEAAGRGLMAFSPPEISNADLTALVLDLKNWGVSGPNQLKWLTPPDAVSYTRSETLLKRLGALDLEGRITDHGKAMSSLGMHPRLAHMVLTAKQHDFGWLAVHVAALLSERDILKNIKDVDMRLRLEGLWLVKKKDIGQARRLGVDASAAEQVLQQAKVWAKQLGIHKQLGMSLEKVAVCIAFAYPDRIAGKRANTDVRYHLSGGRGAALMDDEPLAGQKYLAVAHLDQGGGSLGQSRSDARIFLAAPIHLSDLEYYFEQDFENVDRIEWDDRQGDLICQREVRLDQLVISAKPFKSSDPAHIHQALLGVIRKKGLNILPWDKKSHGLVRRVRFVLDQMPDADLPDYGEQALLDHLEDWLLPFMGQTQNVVGLQKLNLYEILHNGLSWDQQQTLDELAPTHIRVPSGSNIPIDYDESPPVLAVRLQEMFGLMETPSVLKGQVPLKLHLLSPAQRPLQVTQDLAGFWASSYEAVKKDMKGRYPKHFWPDNPAEAMPTNRTKKFKK